MKALKRFTAVVASLALTVGMCVSVFAGSTWGDYIGFDGSQDTHGTKQQMVSLHRTQIHHGHVR